MSQQQGLQRRPQGQGQTGLALERLPTANNGIVTTNSAQEASEWIEAAYAAGGQVVTPFNHVPDLAPGFGIAYSEVAIRDFTPQGNDIYPITGATGRFGLHKAPLDAIGRGYGVDWPREWTRDEKFNDERDHDPYCKKVSVAGRYRDADGEWKTLPPLEKEIDLREGSSEVLQIRANQEYKETRDLPPDATPQAREQRLKSARRKADAEIAQLRKFIGMHARTKARLAVIRTIVRGSYTLPELQTGPFRIFRVIKNYKAPADRPELQAKIDDAAVSRLMGASELLFGEATISTRELPPVSDDDSPPPEDAGVIAAAVATAEVEPEIKTCTPEECFGHGSNHVRACSIAVNPAANGPATEHKAEDNAWVIPEGQAKGLKITDPKVTPETLIAMRDDYAKKMDPKGGIHPHLTDEAKDFFSGVLRECQDEIRRRGMEDTGVKKY